MNRSQAVRPVEHLDRRDCEPGRSAEDARSNQERYKANVDRVNRAPQREIEQSSSNVGVSRRGS